MADSNAKYDPHCHHRRSLRLQNYDYTQVGAYFVTICTKDRKCLFGEIMDSEIRLNEVGQIVIACWNGIPNHFPNVELDMFVVMPNHLHGVIVIVNHTDAPVGAGLPRPYNPEIASPQKPTLGQIVAYFKYQSTKHINQMRGTPGMPVWQRNYYDHVIRNDGELNRIRQYIQENLSRWAEDSENPANC